MNNGTEMKIVGLYAQNLLAEYSIHELAKMLGRKGYGFVHEKVTAMIQAGILKKRVVGTSSLCSLNLDEYNTVLMLCGLESWKAKEMYACHKPLKVLLEQFVAESKQYNTVHAVVIFGSYAKGTAKEKSDVDLLVVVEDRKRESVSRIANTLTLSHSVELNTVVLDKKLFQEMLTEKGINVGKEALKYRIVIYGCENFFELVREVKDDLKI